MQEPGQPGSLFMELLVAHLSRDTVISPGNSI